MSQVAGKFDAFDGTVRIDRENPESSSVTFTIQAASIDANEMRRDEHLRSADFFDTAATRPSPASARRVKPTGEGSDDVTGDFTMRGVTKGNTLPVKVLGE